MSRLREKYGMIIGIGCDIVNIERVATAMQRHGERFLSRIYHTVEIEQMPSDMPIVNLYRYLAKRFAAKEAFAKALGTGIGAQISFKDVYVQSQANGKPELYCSKPLPQLEKTRLHVSLSDDPPFAMAFVLIEGVATETDVNFFL